MPKIISKEVSKLKKGLDAVADCVKITIGPRGRNVIIENGQKPIIANDGGRIAKDITLKDPIENMGAQIIKDVIQRTSDDVGGGRTASAIITQALVEEGLKLVNKGFNANLLKKGMMLAVKDIHAELDKMARKVKGKDLEKVATISTESEELGKVIADTINKIGTDGIVTVEESSAFGITSEIAEGLKFDKGFLSPYMVTDPERMEAIYKDISVLIYDNKLDDFAQVQPLLDKMKKDGKKDLLIIAEDVDESVLRVFAFAKFNGLFKVLAIKTPGIGDMKKFCQEDLAALTGASIVKDFKKDSIQLGFIKKIVAKRDSSVIFSAGDIKTWITTLKTRRELTDNKWEKDQYDERIAKLQNGIAVIKVGANSDTEIKYLKLKIEDGVNETKRALEEGIVIGGNCAYLHTIKASPTRLREVTEDEYKGVQIVVKAIQAPLRQIIENSAGSPDVIIEKILTSDKLTTGYDSLENKVVDDMYQAGIIDAVKVTKTVLSNAVSAASMFLSIDTAIAEEVKE